MVNEWLCPHCGRKFYSANEARKKQYVTCANCGKRLDNPYFQGMQKKRMDDVRSSLRS